MKRWSLTTPFFACLFVVAGVVAGCNEAPLKQTSPDAGASAGGLSPDQAARVIAKIGDRTITLGDYARALERMDQYDRLRYQSKERRRELLEEMIDVELLAEEAKRLGLDKDPETADALRAILRDAVLAASREGLPTPAQISEQEVRAFFESHADRFVEPERRRVAAIVMKDKKEAEKVLAEALKIKKPAEWGELFVKHSLTAPKHKGPATPAELAGDLGIVGPMEDPKGNSVKVPDTVRAAAFKLREVNDVAPALVEAEGRWFIVRLNGVNQPHKRTLAQADKAIRVLLIQEKMADRERALEEDLRKKFPVVIDDNALGAVKLPQGVEKAAESGPPRGLDGGAETPPNPLEEGEHEGAAAGADGG
jgi:peptidyl-prolyl cis-trans isomerase C